MNNHRRKGQICSKFAGSFGGVKFQSKIVGEA
jgi:hypothetical protein